MESCRNCEFWTRERVCNREASGYFGQQTTPVATCIYHKRRPAPRNKTGDMTPNYLRDLRKALGR